MKSLRPLLAALFTSGVAAQVPPKAANAPSNAMREMRLQWLTRAMAPASEKSDPDEVVAALMDWPMGDQTITVLASSIGDASLYTTSTFGIIGGIGHEDARNAASAFVACAKQHLRLSSPTTDYSYPDAQHIKFFFVTRTGTRSVLIRPSDVEKTGSAAYDLYAHAQAVVTELRLITQKGKSH